MLFHQRMKYLSFLENQKQMKKDWDKKFGDRKNEIVFIGQEMDKEKIRTGT